MAPRQRQRRVRRRPGPAALVLVLAVLLAAACSGRRRPASVGTGTDAALAAAPAPADAADDAAAWAALGDRPRVVPARVLTLPARRDRPLVSAVGPVVVDGVAIVGSSQLGFVAVDPTGGGGPGWRRATGPHLAPPLPLPDGVLLVADCEGAPLPPAGQRVLGCYRLVSPSGDDRAAGTITGDRAGTAAFAAEPGAAALFPLGPDRVRWQRGAHAVEVDLLAGQAGPVAPEPDVVIARAGARTWRIGLDDEALVGTGAGGGASWRVDTRFAAVLGVVPGQAHEVPMVRVAHLDGTSGRGFVELLDIDATGSRRGQAAHPVPGIVLLAHAFSAGATTLAIRLDTSLRHDFIAAYDRSAALHWVWPLPVTTRLDPVGLAITDQHVLVFHDGEYLSVLAF
jgi:hypothetical protein